MGTSSGSSAAAGSRRIASARSACGNVCSTAALTLAGIVMLGLSFAFFLAPALPVTIEHRQRRHVHPISISCLPSASDGMLCR
jgi:hypothetical protein